MEKYKFIKKVEKMINPEDIATLQVIAPLNKFIPNKLQNHIITSSADKNPYMGFVVEPYSCFLCYEITDLEQAKKHLPDGFEIIKSKIFNEDTPKYYIIFTLYNIHTSAFYGTRLEVNIIAQSNISNLTSWVIIDYDTNTLSHDLKNGVTAKTCDQTLLTTDFTGNIIVDFNNLKTNNTLIFDANIINAKKIELDQELWLDGNLSIGYGNNLGGGSNEVFSLKFDPGEVLSAFKIEPCDINIEVNTWLKDIIKPQPAHVVYFAYAQHFLSDSPGHTSNTFSREAMVKSVQELDLDTIPDYSSKPLRTMMKRGLIFNIIISWVLIFTIIYLVFIK